MGVGSLACDPKCGFFKSPTPRHVSQWEQVRDVTFIRLMVKTKSKGSMIYNVVRRDPQMDKNYCKKKKSCTFSFLSTLDISIFL